MDINTILIIVTIVLAIGAAMIWFIALRKSKKVKDRIKLEREKTLQETLNDFETAERRYIEHNGEIEPTRILWDIAAAHSRAARNLTVAPSRIGERENITGVQGIPIAGDKLQIPRYPGTPANPIGTPGTTDNTGSDQRPEKHHRKGLFGRRLKHEDKR